MKLCTNTSLGLHSTQHAIITLVDRITSSLDSGDLVIGVFSRFEKGIRYRGPSYMN